MLRATLLACAAAAYAASNYPDYAALRGTPMTVTYDNRSVLINGERALFMSFGLHYPRLTPAMWRDVLAKAKTDGYNMVQTYVFWYAHEPNSPSDWAMDGGLNGAFNLTNFLSTCAELGLFVNLRIGPYICAETNFGGYPLWVRDVPGLVSRTSSPAWEATMAAFFNKVVAQTRTAGFWADQGGPIALAQVENELHTSDDAYVEWCGELAANSGAPVPWLMCNGRSANNTINSCNGGDCTSFIEDNGQNGMVLINQPAMWTEDWTGWYQQWLDSSPSGYDMSDAGEASGKASGILKWIARGGSHHNHYMSIGGTDFAHVEGSATQPQYYTKAQFAPDGTENSIMREHMRNLNTVLAAVADPLLNSPAQLRRNVSLPSRNADGDWVVTGQQQAYVYNATADGSGVAFVENNAGGAVTVLLGGQQVQLVGHAAHVVSLGAQGVPGQVLFVSANTPTVPLTRVYTPLSNSSFDWQAYTEPPFVPTTAARPAPPATHPRFWKGSAAAAATTLGQVALSATPLEQLSFTRDDSEVMQYATALTAAQVSTIAAAGAASGSVLLLASSTTGIVLDVFLDGAKAGTMRELSEGGGGKRLNTTLPAAPFAAAAAKGAGLNLTVLSESLGTSKGSGVSNVNATFSTAAIKGLNGTITLGGVNITGNGWSQLSGLAGEALDAMAPENPAAVPWAPLSGAAPLTSPPITWLKTSFTAPPLGRLMRSSAAEPEVNASLHLDVTGLGRGHIFVNGWPVSRFWSALCGSGPCQRYYLIPADILLPGEAANELVLVDIEGAQDLTQVRLVLAQLQAPPPPPACDAPVVAGAPVATFDCASPNAGGLTWQQVTPPGSPPASTYAFQLAGTQLCLAAAGKNPSTNTPAVQLAACDASGATAAQLWTTSSGSLISRATMHCADLPGENATLGVALDVWPCNAGTNQEFAFNATSQRIVAALNRGCLGVCHATSAA